jgi:hypothetical protein
MKLLLKVNICVFSILSILLTLFEASCSRESEVIAPPPSGTESDFGTYNVSAYLPSSVGSRWIYHYDSGTERAVLDRRIEDTIRVSNNLILSRYSEDVLVNVPPTYRPIVGYLAHRGGTIYYGMESGTTRLPKVPILASPIVVGHQWATDALGIRDSFRIVSVGSEQFHGTSIDTVVLVKRWSTLLVDSLWFGRNVGILRESKVTQSGWAKRQLDSVSIVP